MDMIIPVHYLASTPPPALQSPPKYFPRLDRSTRSHTLQPVLVRNGRIGSGVCIEKPSLVIAIKRLKD
jgi:hypothetical protein